MLPKFCRVSHEVARDKAYTTKDMGRFRGGTGAGIHQYAGKFWRDSRRLQHVVVNCPGATRADRPRPACKSADRGAIIAASDPGASLRRARLERVDRGRLFQR